MAMLRHPDGRVDLARAGETIDTPGGPVRVTEIAPRRVRIEHGGQPRELVMPERQRGDARE